MRPFKFDSVVVSLRSIVRLALFLSFLLGVVGLAPVRASSDLHNRCALLLSSSHADNGQSLHEMFLSLDDPVLPAAYKNQDLFTLWNGLLEELKHSAQKVPVEQLALGIKVYDVYMITIDPAQVRAALPPEVQAQAHGHLQAMQAQTTVIFKKIKTAGKDSLTKEDRGVLRSILPWLVVYTAQQDVQVQLCHNGSSVFLRIDPAGSSVYNQKFARPLWEQYRTSVLFYAGANTFWSGKVKFNVLKGKNIIMPFTMILEPGWRDGVLRALKKAQIMSSDQLYGTPFNGMVVGTNFGHLVIQEDPFYFFNNLQTLQYDFGRFWREIRRRVRQGNTEKLPIVIKQAARVIRKLIVYANTLALFDVQLWRQLLAVLAPDAFQLFMETNHENFVIAELTISEEVASVVRHALPQPQYDTIELRPGKPLTLRVLLPPGTPWQEKTDQALLKLIDQQLAITDQYLHQRGPIWEQTDRVVDGLRNVVKDPTSRPDTILSLLREGGPYHHLLALIAEEFKMHAPTRPAPAAGQGAVLPP